MANTLDPEPPQGSYKIQPSDASSFAEITTVAPLASPLPPQHPQLSTRWNIMPPATNPLEDSIHLLPALAAQPPHYIRIHIHARPYLVTEGDTIRLPFHMPNATPGAILRLNKATVLGSRDMTFRGTPWVPEQFFVVRALVVGIESDPFHIEYKKHPKHSRVRRVKSKHRHTVIRITELAIRTQEDVDAEAAVAGPDTANETAPGGGSEQKAA